jgi:hypothetical protein
MAFRLQLDGKCEARARRSARAAGIRRVAVSVLRVVLVGLSMGVTPPSLVTRFVRQEDAIVQVAEEEVP